MSELTFENYRSFLYHVIQIIDSTNIHDLYYMIHEVIYRDDQYANYDVQQAKNILDQLIGQGMIGQNANSYYMVTDLNYVVVPISH